MIIQMTMVMMIVNKTFEFASVKRDLCFEAFWSLKL